MNEMYPERNILCIDLKSFFASCECVERGLNPFTYPLVVANKKQGQGAITLAVTPYLKSLGVKSRGRLYESKEVINIYLNFVSIEDLHIYSIDECFLDVTHYLKMYKMTDEELAKKILATIYNQTGLTATCGIGPNMLLAKIAMDIEAKHNKNNIAKWNYNDIKDKLWPITPLSNMWGIGKRMEKNLNNKNILKDKFGVIGLELWNHANGIDLSIIKDYKNSTKSESYSHSQVLFKDYNENNIKIIINEMIEVLTTRLRKNNKLTKCIGFGIGYSKEIDNGFYHTIKLDVATDSNSEIFKYCLIIFDRFYENLPIRKVSISLANLEKKENKQLNFFDNTPLEHKNIDINEQIDEIKNKFGKNSLLKATNLLNDSTAIERNKKIGGHYA